MGVSFSVVNLLWAFFEFNVLHTVTGVVAKLQYDGCKITYCPLHLYNKKIPHSFKQIA